MRRSYGLYNLRMEYGLTQEEVSKRTGIPLMSVRRYEYGEREPKWDALIALAKLYGMSPGQLLNQLIGWRDDHPKT